jgi:hypothetical protein
VKNKDLHDKHLRGPLWRAIRWYNNSGVNPLDVARVGDPADLRLGTGDPDSLLHPFRSHTTFPPTIVVSTRVSARSATGHVK